MRGPPKMLDSARLFGLIKYVGAVLLLFFLAFSYLRGRAPVPAVPRGHYDEVLGSFPDDKKSFIADLLQNEVGGSELDGTELASLCAGRRWYPDDKAVIVSCEPLPGGVGAVKNGHLNCIRFAIEIGAQLILPRVHTRSTSDITNLHGGQQSKGVGLEYMFDKAHLVDSLAAYCPQLEVHDSLDDLYDRPSLLKPVQVSFAQMTGDEMPFVSEGLHTTITHDPSNLRQQFVKFLNSELPIQKRHYPVRVHLANTMFTWPTGADGDQVRRDFGRLLRVREDVRILAGSALYNLAERYGAWPLPTTAGDGGDDDDDDDDGAGGAGRKYLGIHLRTEKDAASWSFPPYGDQSAYFFSFLQRLPPPPPGRQHVVYLATGLGADDDDVRRFRARAADEANATVVLKRDLLGGGGGGGGDGAGALGALTWDQRALVDYEVLLRAGTVLGCVESSFAWDVALRRAEAYGEGWGSAEAGGWFTAKPGGGGDQGAADREAVRMWADRWTRLYGKAERAVSIYLGTWP